MSTPLLPPQENDEKCSTGNLGSLRKRRSSPGRVQPELKKPQGNVGHDLYLMKVTFVLAEGLTMGGGGLGAHRTEEAAIEHHHLK